MPDTVRGHIVDRKVERLPWSGCWIWLGGLTPTGYGQVVGPFGRELVHRAFYTVYKGVIPDGLQVLHTCDIRCCVNPDHLYAGTHMDNMRDKRLRFSGTELGRNSLFNQEQRENILLLLKQGLTQQEVAKIFCCSQATISHVTKEQYSCR